MLIYFFVDLLIVFLGILLMNKQFKVGNRLYENGGNNVYFVLITVLLIYISSFRGDFTSDYSGYIDIYNRFGSITLESILKRDLFAYPEKGYLLFQYIVKHVFNDVIYLFIASSIVIVISNTYHIRKYTSNLLLGFIAFVELGTYYTSFNVMRQILAVSVVLMGSKFLYERKPVRYFLFVIAGGLIHTSAFYMIPMYFVLNLKLKKKALIVYPIILVVLLAAMPFLITIVQRYYWSWYFTGEWQYGGYTWRSAIIPLTVNSYSLFTYFNNYRKQLKSNEDESVELGTIENIWLNASFIYTVFVIMGFRLALMSRFASFLSLYSLSFFCMQIQKDKYRKIIIMVVIFLSMLYCQITRSDNPYYFIWTR